jgi:hypothetical protein
MAYIDNPYANSLRQAQAMPAVQQALGGYEGGMDGLMRLFQQQYSRPQQQTGGLGSMNSGGMGYGNMFRMQNERMPQYGGYGGYGGGMRPQPYQQMPQPQYQPHASPYQQQYPQPQRYGGYGRQQQYGGYGGGYGGMQNRYQPQQYGGYGGGGQQYGQQYGGGGYGQQYGGGYGQQSGQQYGGGYGQQYGGGYGNQNNYQSYGGQNQDKPPYPPMY